MIFILGVLFLLTGGWVLVWVVQRHPEPVQQRGPDGIDWQGAQYFTDGEAAALEATATCPAGCAESCCWETRLTELHDAYDWHAAEHEMRSKR